MADKSLFGRLQRLFSTDVVIRNVGGTQLKVVDTNNIQTTGKYQTNSLMDRFTRLYTYNKANIFNPNLNYQTLRIQLYSDYEAMDTDPIIASALDIIADEATVKNDQNEVLGIKSSDENIQRVLYNLFYDVLNIEFNLWSWTRNMVKYGDFFLKLEIAEKFGVYNVLPYTVYHIARHEGNDPENPQNVEFELDPDGIAASSDTTYLPNKKQTANIVIDNYEMAHFRLISDVHYLPYGRSYLEPARKIFKQTSLMEDAMLIHRIMRAPEKRMFYINVGSIPPNEVDQFMQKTINSMKKTPYVGDDGQYNLKFNIQNMMEDFYLPVRGGQRGTEIDSLQGMEFGGIDDIEYLRNRMMAALKVPKAFIGYEEGVEGKATLAQEDIRFARSVERIQKIVLSELTKIAIVHLYSQGYTDEELVNFELELTTPSIIYEQEKANLWSEKVTLASDIKDLKMVSQEWVYKNIFNMSEDEWKEEQFKVINDLKLGFRHEQIESEGNDPVKTGESFGTPHDLASLSQQSGDDGGGDNPFGENSGGAPEGGFDGAGRPKEAGNYKTDDNPFGRDPLGNRANRPTKNERYNAHTVINQEQIDAVIGRMKSKTKTKEIIIESLKEDTNDESLSLLDEKNILDS